MREQFLAFLQNPSCETFLTAHQACVRSDRYQPYSADLGQAQELANQDEHQRALQVLLKSMPNLLLSPGAHMLASFLFKQTGDDRSAEVEANLARACLQGILSTGDGTRQRPYRVTRVSDEYDLLAVQGKRVKMQGLCQLNGRMCDVLSTEDGSELVFDVTDCMGMMAGGDLPFPADGG